MKWIIHFIETSVYVLLTENKCIPFKCWFQDTGPYVGDIYSQLIQYPIALVNTNISRKLRKKRMTLTFVLIWKGRPSLILLGQRHIVSMGFNASLLPNFREEKFYLPLNNQKARSSDWNSIKTCWLVMCMTYVVGNNVRIKAFQTKLYHLNNRVTR